MKFKGLFLAAVLSFSGFSVLRPTTAIAVATTDTHFSGERILPSGAIAKAPDLATRFKQIKVGMTPAQVKAVMGQPDEITQEGYGAHYLVWVYNVGTNQRIQLETVRFLQGKVVKGSGGAG